MRIMIICIAMLNLIDASRCFAAEQSLNALKEIRDVVKEICMNPSAKGKLMDSSIKGSGEASVKLKLANVKAGTEASFRKSEWEGVQSVLPSDRGADNKSYRNCVEKLTPLFLSKFAPTKKPAKKINKSKDPQTYIIRPTLPINQPISQTTEIEWAFSSKDKTQKCSSLVRKEYIFTILGRGVNGEPSVAKRKTTSDVSKTTCNVVGQNQPQVTDIRGEFEGKELLAHQTTEGLWIFDELPEATEKQKLALKNDGFIEPFAGYPREKVPVGKVITFKDEELSLVLGTVFPGKKEGTVTIKFDSIVNDREPVAMLSYSMNTSTTSLDENYNEMLTKMSLNGGGRLSLLDNVKINFAATLTGIISVSMPSSPSVVLTGPATMKIALKEL